MMERSRRNFLRDGAALVALAALGGCATTEPEIVPVAAAPNPFAFGDPNYALMYGPRPEEKFPLPAVDLTQVNPAFLRAEVYYPTDLPPDTIVVDPAAYYLYYTQPGQRAIRYGVGVGKQGFEWAGDAYVNSKQEWPDWYPPAEMIERRPEIRGWLTELQSGIGMPGGPTNPIGARGLSLWQDNKDTLYRIHGTNEPQSIGLSVSSGCIRMINQDVMDLYDRVAIGTKVKVLGAGGAALG